MNTLILYWNSVIDGQNREASLIDQPHSVQEYAAFNRSLKKKTALEMPAPNAFTRPPKSSIVSGLFR